MRNRDNRLRREKYYSRVFIHESKRLSIWYMNAGKPLIDYKLVAPFKLGVETIGVLGKWECKEE